MVLEQIFKPFWVEKRPMSAMTMGVLYTFIGIFSAYLIFGRNPGLMTVAFTAILLIPSLNMILTKEEIDARTGRFSLGEVFKDHKDVFEVYFFLFLGIFIAFALIALVLPEQLVKHLFSPQLEVIGITGNAYSYSFTSLLDLLANNMKVLLVVLILSLVYGAGAILFLAWNASVWGVIFGFLAQQAAGWNILLAFGSFGSLILPVIPHLITEGLSYFTASLGGGILSKAMFYERWFSPSFNQIVKDALVIVLLGLVLVLTAGLLEIVIL